MSTKPPPDKQMDGVESRRISAAARRALAEADERRRNAQRSAASAEVGGRGGLDPGRFGDWEVRGLTSDF